MLADQSESDQLAAIRDYDAWSTAMSSAKRRRRKENKKRKKTMKGFQLNAKSSSVCFSCAVIYDISVV